MAAKKNTEILIETEVGAIESPFLPGTLVSPRVLTVDQAGITLRDGSYPRGIPPKDLIWKFIRLRKAKSIESFSRRFGGLALCKHGLPFGHSARCADSDSPVYLEAYEHWARWASAFEGAMQVGLSLAKRKIGDKEHWEAMYAPFNPRFDFENAISVAAAGELQRSWSRKKLDATLLMVARRQLMAAMQVYIQLADISPQIAWSNERQKLEVVFDRFGGGPNLFAQLVLRLLPIVADPLVGCGGLALCRVKNHPYIPPHRKPRTGFDSYCEEHKHFKYRAYRERKNAKKADNSTLAETLATRTEKAT